MVRAVVVFHTHAFFRLSIEAETLLLKLLKDSRDLMPRLEPSSLRFRRSSESSSLLLSPLSLPLILLIPDQLHALKSTVFPELLFF